MILNKSFLFIGGDKRQLYAAKKLINLGHTCDIFGFSGKESFDYNKKYDVFVLPAPLSKDGENIFAPYSENSIPFSTLKNFTEPKLIAGGFLNEKIYSLFENADFFDFLKSDTYSILNGALTAEGAICTAILNTPFSLAGASVLICGFGKIGKPLSLKLSALGANVYVAARKPCDLSYIKAYNLIPIEYENLENCADLFDIIFNTVPSLMFNEDILKNLNKRCLYTELASSPGGLDQTLAKKFNIKYINAPSLPGKYLPESAGEIMSKIILSKAGEI